MAVPVTPGERITDLRKARGWDQKTLAENSGLSESQISRIENGKIGKLSHDILIKLAKAFHVSTDYILGLTTVSVPKSYDISELGLSEGAVKGLVTGTVNVEILNRLMEHKNFPRLLELIQIYFSDTAAMGIMSRNEILDFATASLSDFIKDHPEHRGEARKDARFINAQKVGAHEADIEKIKNLFISILRDIKADIDNGVQPGEIITAEMLQGIKAALPDKPSEQITMDDVVAATTAQLGKMTPMNDEAAGMFQSLMKMMMEQSGQVPPAPSTADGVSETAHPEQE